jgi:hypothetical protein
MMFPSVKFSRLAQVAAFVIPLLSLGALALPAKAAGQPAFSFSLQLGSPAYGHYRSQAACLTNNQIAAQLQGEGLRNIRFGSELHHHAVTVYGAWHHRDYSLVVDRCSGAIYGAHPVQASYPHHYGNQGYGVTIGGGYYDNYDDNGYYDPRYPDRGYDYGRDGYDSSRGGSFQFGFGN